MTLLPASSVRTIHTPGLVFKDLFKQGSSSEPGELSTAEHLLMSLKGLLEKEEVEAGATELPGQVFPYLDGVNSETPAFPYLSEDFRSEPVHQPISDVDSSPVASVCDSGDIIVEADGKQECVEVSLDGELLNAGASRGLVENSDRFYLFEEFSEESNKLQNHDPSYFPFW